MVGEVNRLSLSRKAYFDEPFQPADFAMALDGLPVYGMEPRFFSLAGFYNRLAASCFSIIHLEMGITRLIQRRV